MPTVAECSTEVNESLGASGPRFSQETALEIDAFLPSEKKMKEGLDFVDFLREKG